MRVSKIRNAIAIGLLAMSMTLASSWYGAMIYVKMYPRIIEYLEPVHVVAPSGEPLTEIHYGRPTPIIIRGHVRRQPDFCWGTYIYYLSSPEANLQFGILRSIDLRDSVQEMEIRNFFTVPAGLPVGEYRVKVAIYPTCDGVDLKPQSLDLGTTVSIVP
jgi:hypothetical protein